MLCLNFANPKGYHLSFWAVGISCFGASVVIANIKVILFSKTFSILSAFMLIGSIGVYIISFAIVNNLNTISELSNEFFP